MDFHFIAFCVLTLSGQSKSSLSLALCDKKITSVKVLSFPFVFRDLVHKKHVISFHFVFIGFIFLEMK